MREYVCLARQCYERADYSVCPVQAEHVEAIRQWRNAQRDVLRQRDEITPQQQQRYYEAQIWPDMARRQPSNVLFAYSERDTLIGYGGLVHIAWEHRRAELSFLLDPRRAGDREGYARDFAAFLELMKQVAFRALALNRLFTETFAIRTHHIEILESCGFRPEGAMREHVIIDGMPIDSLLHGCLASHEA
ncbi:MAG TPA: GNAT family N-acetyltransferase [Burkholderiales bacterium]|nr:GNAT family N-acetyltransferase [Burkholderiales bacterium]